MSRLTTTIPAFEPIALHMLEAINRPFRILLEGFAGKCLRDQLGQCFQVALFTPTQQRYWHGMLSQVTEIMQGHPPELQRVRLLLQPQHLKLQQQQHCKVYRKLPPRIIMQQILEQTSLPHRFLASSATAPVDLIVQYKESAWHFLLRLLKRLEDYFYFAHQPQRHELLIASDWRFAASSEPPLYQWQHATNRHDGPTWWVSSDLSACLGRWVTHNTTRYFVRQTALSWRVAKPMAGASSADCIQRLQLTQSGLPELQVSEPKIFGLRQATCLNDQGACRLSDFPDTPYPVKYVVSPSQPTAWGARPYVPPGGRVILSFLEGDPERAVILGAISQLDKPWPKEWGGLRASLGTDLHTLAFCRHPDGQRIMLSSASKLQLVSGHRQAWQAPQLHSVTHEQVVRGAVQVTSPAVTIRVGETLLCLTHNTLHIQSPSVILNKTVNLAQHILCLGDSFQGGVVTQGCANVTYQGRPIACQGDLLSYAHGVVPLNAANLAITVNQRPLALRLVG